MATKPDRCASCTPANVDAVFTAKVLPLVDTIRASIMESRTLGATRDALLPKLLSGEVRVPKSETAVEEVV
jgi:type I restriction enzyme S subunit